MRETRNAQASPPHGGNGRIDQICGHQLKNFRVPVQNLRHGCLSRTSDNQVILG